ncbi:MAG: pantoate kinase [Candidatus Methanospirareceae archaeon]
MKIKAYSPSHITGFFYIVDNKNPLYKGSVGCGIVLEAGCITEVSYSEKLSIEINGREEEAKTTRYVVKRLLSRYRNPEIGGKEIAVKVSTNFDVPIGCGFGASGSGALSTALAINELLSLRMTLNEVARVAHAAEVENGTGLGDVIAETYGGVVIRKKPGAPGIGEIDKIVCATEEVCYVSIGELSTKELLRDADIRRRINKAGKEAMKELKRRPTLENFMLLARKFSLETEIISEKCREAIEAVDAEGKVASAAMLGNTVFVIGESEALSEFGIVKKTRISHLGATLIRGNYVSPS